MSFGDFLKDVYNASLPSSCDLCQKLRLSYSFLIFHSMFTKQPLLMVEYDLGLLLRESHSPVRKVGKCYKHD